MGLTELLKGIGERRGGKGEEGEGEEGGGDGEGLTSCDEGGDEGGDEEGREEGREEDMCLDAALVVEGPSLSFIFGDAQLETLLLAVARQCKSVVACRVSPSQKALIVKLHSVCGAKYVYTLRYEKFHTET